MELSDGSILSIYIHHDNFPEYNGRILQTHYNTREKVAELIGLGDCSSIWNDTIWGQPGPEPYSARGEDCPPHLDKNLKEYLSDGEEYAYVYTKNNTWICYKMNQFSDKEPEIVPIPSEALMA